MNKVLFFVLVAVTLIVGLILYQQGQIKFGKIPEAVSTSNSVKTSAAPFDREILVVLENHSYEQIIGNQSLPFLNSLAQTYGQATNYYANTHPSIGNYFMLDAGQIFTTNDNFSGVINADTIMSELDAASKSWRVYVDDLPSAGYVGPNTASYLKRHNPAVYFKYVLNNPALKTHVVPIGQFNQDLASNKLPNFIWIVPNSCHSAHDCSLMTADNWLQQTLTPLLNNRDLISRTMIAVTFDEGLNSDAAHGGGHVLTVLAGDKIKPNFVSNNFYQHQSLLKTLLVGLGVNKFPGAAATASAMTEFFK